MENYQVRFCSQGEKGDHLSLDNEMIDLICWRHYGATRGVVEVVLEANPGLAEYSGSLPSALRIKLPIIKEPLKKSVLKVWS